MATHFHPLVVSEIIRETPDCVSVRFQVPENLKPHFQYREGQNITIRKTINGEEIRRSYSICMAPHEQQLKVAVKKIEGGLFSSFANDELKAGDVLDVMPPSGQFHARLQTQKPGNYLAIAAGSGITPVLSIIKHSLQTDPNGRFTLLYNNRSRGSIIFFEELEALKNKYLERFQLIHILSREVLDTELFHGRITETKLAELKTLLDFTAFDAVYLCGPETMIKAAAGFLEKEGLPPKKIHFELFNAATPVPSNSAQKETAFDGPVSEISITLDGRTFSFSLAQNGSSILDAALKQGADLPFACKGGVCCTCRAKLLEGSVHMDVNYALEQEEIDRGFVLTCQSHPRTEKVVIDFDEK